MGKGKKGWERKMSLFYSPLVPGGEKGKGVTKTRGDRRRREEFRME